MGSKSSMIRSGQTGPVMVENTRRRFVGPVTSLIAAILVLVAGQELMAAEWQWCVPVPLVVSGETSDHPQAFLWIPPQCKQVRGVVVGQHNMSEEGILEHPGFRRTLSKLDFAEVWVTPGFNMVFDFNQGAGGQFNRMMEALATESGYGELAFAPVVPIGHSAYASYPWNFAAWNPQRTLAVISVHGDAPLTNLTGSGRPNPDWEDRRIDGVPGLMVMGEYEWRDDRLAPTMAFRQKFPRSTVSLLADADHGHFDVSDQLVAYLCLFLEKAAHYRLPKQMPVDRPSELVPLDVCRGWLADRWQKDKLPRWPSAPYDRFTGQRGEAFWYIDKQMARATEAYYAKSRGKAERYIGFKQNGTLLPFNPKSHARIVADFLPEDDGLTFTLKPVLTDSSRTKVCPLPAGTHIRVDRICGPVQKINDTTFTVRFYRMGLNNPKRTADIWLMASMEGDKEHKTSVQQVTLRIPYRFAQGQTQQIRFDSLPDVNGKCRAMDLHASSSGGLPVHFYVKQGPAEIVGDRLTLTRIPPKAQYPVKVTVVAWQHGQSHPSMVKTAGPVEQNFLIFK
ncbi:MAG: hypothetical protein QM786_05030 [Breznakibacter sp.]